MKLNGEYIKQASKSNHKPQSKFDRGLRVSVPEVDPTVAWQGHQKLRLTSFAPMGCRYCSNVKCSRSEGHWPNCPQVSSFFTSSVWSKKRSSALTAWVQLPEKKGANHKKESGCAPLGVSYSSTQFPKRL